MSMSDIANIKADVDAHLWRELTLPLFYLTNCLLNQSFEHCLISSQNRCHIDL
jgi:hypothetical protein